jgi:CheY-like chemotaxis protein
MQSDVIEPTQPAILIAEDKVCVRRLIRLSLLQARYMILEAGDGVQALSIVRSYRGPIALAILDLIMPHAGGMDVASQLAIDRPATAILYISGFAESVAAQSIAQVKPWSFLQKPFTPSELVDRVSRILGSRQTAG